MALTTRPGGPVVGQDAARESVNAFLDRATREPAGLRIDGEIGAGKTTLWQAAIAEARARGFRLLACRPSESESSLTFAALGDLLEDGLDDTDALPPPQRRALRVATLLEDPSGPPPDQRAVSVATLGLIRGLAARVPLLVAVDDAHWLDPATARVLQFVVRRLQSERVGLLIAQRAGGGSAGFGPGDLEIAARAVASVRPLPLDPDGLDALFRAELNASFPRPLLRQVARASGGNPLFALEIGRGIRRGEIRPEPGQRLPVPATLHQLVEDRVAGLSAELRELLFAAAAVAEPTVDLLTRLGDDRDPSAALQRAEVAGVVALDGGRIRFTHPLFASTLYHAIDGDRRRALHRRLAGLVVGAHERARQLSLGADGPDATVASALDQAASAAVAQGAPDSAADLAEQAIGLTPDDDREALDRRRLVAAEYHFAAGDGTRSRALLEQLVKTSAGPRRADVLRRLAKVRYRCDSSSVAANLLTRALEDAGDDRALRAGIERDLAWAITLCGDVADAARHAAAALELVEGAADSSMLAELLAARSMARFLRGQGIDEGAMGRAIALERPGTEVPIEWRPGMTLAMMRRWSGDLAAAGAAFEALHRETLDAGDETSLPFLLAQLSETSTLAGNWQRALETADEAHSLALQTGQEPIRAIALYARALVQAHLGLVEPARESARDGLELAKRGGSVLAMFMCQSVLGFIELSCDEPAAADECLGPLVAWLEVVGISEPGVIRFVPDEAEALIALGQFDRADALLRSFEADAQRLERGWAILAGARARAMLLAAKGETSLAIRSLELAIATHGPDAGPFDLARAKLMLGTVQRRTRRRKVARSSLSEALALFEELGAGLWAARTRALLGGPSETAEPAVTSSLTPAERRVVELVAAGSTNRAAADRLFVSVRAVEVHLTNVYRKLGVRSRTELAALLSQRRSEDPVERAMQGLPADLHVSAQP